MDDEIGVVNMNARIYDPVIGRFLSPDALIPNPGDLQSYNRYSYVNNNPLSFTDPTGHVPVPGGGYEYVNGNFYKAVFKDAVCGDRANDCKKFVGWKKITDPGLIKHLQIRIGVYSEIVQNYGGVSRGNTKETRNNYNNLAAQELAANGKTSRYQNYLDKGYAAHVIYRQLKEQANRRYSKIAAQLAAAAVTGYGAGLAANAADAAVISGVSSFVISGGDLKAALVVVATAGANIGIEGLGVSRVAETISKATVGGIASELNGGKFGEGFAIVGGTVGANNFYEYLVGYGIDLRPGGDAVPKKLLDDPVQYANNVGEATLKPGSCRLCEGSGVSKFFNNIFGVNAVAGLHDKFQIGLQLIGGSAARDTFNFPGMLPAAGITALASAAPIAPYVVSSGILNDEDD